MSGEQSKDIPQIDTSLAYSIELNQTNGPELLVCATISLVCGKWVMVISVRAPFLWLFFLYIEYNIKLYTQHSGSNVYPGFSLTIAYYCYCLRLLVLYFYAQVFMYSIKIP